MKILEDLTEEYIEASGRVTCELSLDNLTYDLALKLLELNKKLLHLDSEWVIRPCDVCLEHNPSKPFHVEIDKFRYLTL